jgi:FMN phosphatase YigB (HAD superfamily)
LWESVGPGVVEALSALRARAVRMIVVSNSDGRLGDLLRDAGLAGFFELLVDSADAGVEKPDPHPAPWRRSARRRTPCMSATSTRST